MRLCSFEGIRIRDQLEPLHVDPAHMKKPLNKSLFRYRLNKETSMAPECVFLIFHSADLTIVDNNQQILNLLSLQQTLSAHRDSLRRNIPFIVPNIVAPSTFMANASNFLIFSLKFTRCTYQPRVSSLDN